ncbi:hypothetical protein AAMO2058_001137600 [Amorphochlora amoebiformis]
MADPTAPTPGPPTEEEEAELKRMNESSLVAENAPRFFSKNKFHKELKKAGLKGLVAVEKSKNAKTSLLTFEDKEARKTGFEFLSTKKIGKNKRMICRDLKVHDLRAKRKRERDAKENAENPAKRRRSHTAMIIDGVWEVIKQDSEKACKIGGVVGDVFHIRERGRSWTRYALDGGIQTYDNTLHSHSLTTADLNVQPNEAVQQRDLFKSSLYAHSPGELTLAVPVEAGQDIQRPVVEGKGASGRGEGGGENAMEEEDDLKKVRVAVTILRRARDCRSVTTPLWRVPYEGQLRYKMSLARGQIKKLARQLTKLYKPIDSDNHKSPMGGGRLCPLDNVGPSPWIYGYRNKCEFAAGIDVQTSKPMIGFTVGTVKNRVQDGVSNVGTADNGGCVRVASAKGCPHIANPAIDVADAITRMLIDMESWGLNGGVVYDKVKTKGCMRMVIVRCSMLTGEVMVLLQVFPTDLTEEHQKMIEKGLIKACRECDEKWSREFSQQSKKGNDEKTNGYPPSPKFKAVTGLVQLHASLMELPDKTTRTKIVFGPGYLYEELLGVKFRISPTAFFQVNVGAAESLFSSVRKWLFEANNPPKSKKSEKSEEKNEGEGGQRLPVVLDVCCGTGAIGLLMAKYASKVFGLELVAAAVEDAKRNADLNGIRNVEYLVGDAKVTIKEAIKTVSSSTSGDVIAIVDPPRAGLDRRVVKALRNCARVKHVIYVSCNAKSMMEDVKRFVQPVTKQLNGAPFRAVKSRPFDLFPHTLHFEMLMLLSRQEGALDRDALKRKAEEAEGKKKRAKAAVAAAAIETSG